MSNFIPQPNTGSIFPNTRKEEDRHPDMTGNIFLTKELLKERLESTEDGQLVQIAVSAWNNANDRIGLTFKKPYVKPVDQKTQAAESKPVGPKTVEPTPDDDDDVPF